MTVLTRRVLPTQAKEVNAELKALQTRAASTNTLNLGDSGKVVEYLQRHLKAAGLYSGKITGSFDAATDAALKAFQTAKKLPATGVLNKATFTALKAVNRFVQAGFKDAAKKG